MADTCFNCKHYEVLNSLCRAHPPVAFLVPGPDHSPQVISGWPPVRKEHLCGEFVARLGLVGSDA